MYVHKIGSTFAAGSRGPSMAASTDELFLADLPGPLGVGNGGNRWFSGAHSLFWKDSADSLPRWLSRVNNIAAYGRSGSSTPGKDTAIAGRQTITFAGASYLDSTATLDANRNTIYGLVKFGSGSTGVRSLYGPVLTPTIAGQTDDVFSLACGADGALRWLSENPSTSSLAALAAGDRRGVTTLFRATMSPTTGKSILIHGFAESRNTALVAPLQHTGLQLAQYADQGSSYRLVGSVSDLLIVPGVDYSDPAYAAVHARIWSILAGWGGL